MNSEKLYHGTCKAFVAFALQNGGKFGPNCDAVSFTPDLGYARMFAESWQTPLGRKRLEDYFGKVLGTEIFKPIVLEFNFLRLERLYNLHYRDDCGAEEFFVEEGPVDISLCKKFH